ncbi:SDR family NAD(P)-dependent oxidoreductase [Bosea sp. (in: a-proteobacteria)]|uniref:SDR family NAD(P)-dependent oxidoreductase n=1 Tax=Bosea sp. (in: a-proteobacteria) TaxID=1871050 RepID=UPI002611CF5E|nr:SDR family NAD(P)-dependent oxidoreductase [Bosea sp. (in: a-proteobacteria)]MCO5090340.1 SDR family oxidoreductase [Bosea sp. (in: a-proteobacteria)]
MRPFEDLRGKVTLITGAASGIGAAVTSAYAAAGARCAIHYRSSSTRAEQLSKEAREHGTEARIYRADLVREGAAAALVEDVVRDFGRLDVLICNAGGLVARTPLEQTTDAFFDDVINLNFRSVVATCAAAMPHLVQSRGNVILTGSIAARNGGSAGVSLYAAAKAAVQSLVRTGAKEFSDRGVRFNAVAPGVILTDFHKSTPPETLETFRNAIPLKRLGRAEDCVGAYLFLGSDVMSGYITGQVIEINGGQLTP